MSGQAKIQKLSCGAKRRNLVSGFYVLIQLATAIPLIEALKGTDKFLKVQSAVHTQTDFVNWYNIQTMYRFRRGQIHDSATFNL